ncbi:MAG: MinD/ParA family protein [Porticoccaceae bacterium]|nr:MinD/ParA family protein [Porticoccaceae bacterium]
MNTSPPSAPVRVIAVASGKGGVGKTNISVNLAAAFAKKGKNVLLMDADLGLANVDILLGLQPKFDLRHVISNEKTLSEVMVEGPLGIKVIPASSGVASMAELSTSEHAGLVRAFSELPMATDVMIVDTAAGIADSVLTFSKACQEVLVVVCDEPASITDAYALIKVLSRDHGLKRVHVVANMVRSEAHGDQLFQKIRRVTDQFLGVQVEHLGSVPLDDYLRKSVQRQIPVIQAYPRSPSSQAFEKIAAQIDNWNPPTGASGNLEFFVERIVDSYAAAQTT